jgi:spermidine synthase
MSAPRTVLIPLFLVSAAAVGFEIALTRYFAIASWSEYGYWVISITMVGFAVSGVVLSLFKDAFTRRGELLMFAIPVGLVATATAGFYLMTLVPFNPLEFQNPDAWFDQLLNIWKFYAVLFPFYFLTGLYIGLYFLTYQEAIPRVYAADLVGAGVGALLVLALMFWLHPFHLLGALLPLLAIASLLHRSKRIRIQRVALVVGLIALVALCELALFMFNRADFNEYKAIYAPLHVRGDKVVQELRSPRGYFLVLDNFTERLDTDFSNNAKLLKAAAPPQTYGLYNDGNRITSLPKSGSYDESYVRATLDAFPYEVKPKASVLLIDTRGGFRVREVLAQGATAVTALEPDDTLYSLLRTQRDNPVAQALADPRVQLLHASPAMLTASTKRQFDVIDIASDFLNQSDANKFAFTVEAVQGYLGAVKEDGIVSIPASIREFTVYAVKLIDTVRAALKANGVAVPQDNILVYRSSWNVRILISPRPFSAGEIRRLRAFAGKRSFDTSYFKGIDPAKVEIWNDLPLVSFESQTILSRGDKASDALMDETLKLFSAEHDTFVRGHFFKLDPSTHDRPFFYSVLRLSELRTVLKKIALIPREELGLLINVAVLAQSVLIALAILWLPLLRWRSKRPRTDVLLDAVLYFAGLGLGFLFLEIYLIEKASFFLDDRTYGFALVLAGMLIFSGLGSFLSGRYLANPRRGLGIACSVIIVWVLAAWLLMDHLLLSLLGAPIALKGAVLLAVTAPLSVALGFPFPLGLYLFRGDRSPFLPWAWSLNGSFSVIATPLANVLAVTLGYKIVLVLSAALYALVLMAYPVARGENKI